MVADIEEEWRGGGLEIVINWLMTFIDLKFLVNGIDPFLIINRSSIESFCNFTVGGLTTLLLYFINHNTVCKVAFTNSLSKWIFSKIYTHSNP